MTCVTGNDDVAQGILCSEIAFAANANELDFVLTGHENSGSLLARLLAPKRSAIAHAGDA